MPQVWMTYDELATLCGCDAAAARHLASHLSLDRRKSRDGCTRVKLNPALAAKFFAAVRDADFDLDFAIATLRDTHRQMAELLTPDAAGRRRGAA
ncbi:hypothetical protein [Bradyrhizobium liaoningense]|uniref:hypothetical protein n=1 Tax=Bradyrhizobium liaoningense TaxID=43992 RepID=UPI001BAA6EBE|nr:hypothetical protein [Bradyrhizobium liaoningense]MBR0715862.1 hypothetical protein [Bradyrhizobium liaoningense]